MKKEVKAKMLNDIVSGSIKISELIPTYYYIFIQSSPTTWQTDNKSGKIIIVPDGDIEKYITDVLKPLNKNANITPIKIFNVEYEQIKKQLENEI